MGIKGRLRDMTLSDIIQIFHTERKTIAIHLDSDTGYGRIYMKDGNVVHASCRGYKGVEALYRMLSWSDGEFEVVPNELPFEETITDSVESLLLKGFQGVEESDNEDLTRRTYYNDDINSIKLINRLLELGILEKVEEEEHT